ncbi:MAG: hypothetical protein GX051_00060 [Clostridiales bacterium]|nr:hypothetical protein [Clostridiales bacterium]
MKRKIMLSVPAALLLIFFASLCAFASSAPQQEETTTDFKLVVDVNETYTGISDDDTVVEEEEIPKWFWVSIPFVIAAVVWVIVMNVRIRKYSDEQLRQMKEEKLRLKAQRRQHKKKPGAGKNK